MASKPRIKQVTLYRGQAVDYGVVLASGWRNFWHARAKLFPALPSLADRYYNGALDESKLRAELVSMATDAPQAPTLHRFLKEEKGPDMIAGLIVEIRDSFSARWRSRVCHAQLAELETAFFLRYQSYLFNGLHDAFLESVIPQTLHRLAQLLLDFYNAHRVKFNVEGRGLQIAADFMGVLQHYGTLGTPGLDLTTDLDVALWFATHKYVGGTYISLSPNDWGFVYEAQVPMLDWSESDRVPGGGSWPDVRAVNLSDLSPLLLTRIARQRGYYALNNLAWDRIEDFRKQLQIHMRQAAEWEVAGYGSPPEIERRFKEKGLSKDYLFPPVEDDPFKAYLHSHEIKTFQ